MVTEDILLHLDVLIELGDSPVTSEETSVY